MAGLKESLEALKAVWDAIPEDRRTASGDQAKVAALLAGDAFRILQPHLAELTAPAVAAGSKAVALLAWQTPLDEIFKVIELVFPELVKVLKQVAAELGFQEAPPTPPASP